MSEKLKAVVIGGGFAGMLHRDALLADSRVGSVTVVETDRQRRQELRDSEMTAFTSLDSLERELGTPDIAVLALPPKYNLATVEQLANFDPRPEGVLIDKPLALTVADAREIERICAQKFAVAMIGITADFHPEFVAAKKVVDSGKLGRVLTYQEIIDLGGPAAGFYMEPGYGGAIYMEAPHSLRHVENLTGKTEWKVVSAQSGNDHWGKECPDWAEASLIAVDGETSAQMIWHLVNNYTPGRDGYKIHVTGTDGRMTITGFDGIQVTTADGQGEYCSFHQFDMDLRARHLPGFVVQERTFLESVVNNLSSPLPISEGVRIQVLMAEIERLASVG